MFGKVKENKSEITVQVDRSSERLAWNSWFIYDAKKVKETI